MINFLFDSLVDYLAFTGPNHPILVVFRRQFIPWQALLLPLVTIVKTKFLDRTHHAAGYAEAIANPASLEEMLCGQGDAARARLLGSVSYQSSLYQTRDDYISG